MAAKFSGDTLRAGALLDEVVRKSSASRKRPHRAPGAHRTGISAPRPRRGVDKPKSSSSAERAGRSSSARMTTSVSVVRGIARWRSKRSMSCSMGASTRGGSHPSALRANRVRNRQRDLPPRRAAFRGPTPVPGGDRALPVAAREAGTPVWQSFILPMLAGLEAMGGRFDEARTHLEAARLARQEFSDTGTIVTSWAAVAGEVELLAGSPRTQRRSSPPRVRRCARRVGANGLRRTRRCLRGPVPARTLRRRARGEHGRARRALRPAT